MMELYLHLSASQVQISRKDIKSQDLKVGIDTITTTTTTTTTTTFQDACHKLNKQRG
jgi:hypothetical protein